MGKTGFPFVSIHQLFPIFWCGGVIPSILCANPIFKHGDINLNFLCLVYDMPNACEFVMVSWVA